MFVEYDRWPTLEASADRQGNPFRERALGFETAQLPIGIGDAVVGAQAIKGDELHRESS